MVRRRKRETAKEAQSGKEAEDGEGSAKRRRKRRRRLDGAPTMGKVVKGLQQLDRDGRLRALEEHVRSVGGYAQAVCALTDLLKKARLASQARCGGSSLRDRGDGCARAH